MLPTLVPRLFPYHARFAWLSQDPYSLPGERKLLENRQKLVEEYKQRVEKIDHDIAENRRQRGFLHNLLTQTDAPLVKSVEEFMHWLGFQEVRNIDELQPDKKEEDLQIDLDDGGLLVVEVKGIGGTSTDSDCSQITKIRFRRCEEREKLDVKGLYIVNHQRHLAPEDRKNPPFSGVQITDAENDKRGLLSTYELFKVYYMILDRIMTKNEARAALTNNGLVQFTPRNVISLGSPTKFFKDRHVAIVGLRDQMVRKGQSVIIRTNNRFSKTTIESIHVNDVEVEEAGSGEVGLRFAMQLPKKLEILLRVNESLA